MSITEIEIRYAALQNRTSKKESFFFIRDSAVIQKEIPSEHSKTFFSTSEKEAGKLASLKEEIIRSDYEVIEFKI